MLLYINCVIYRTILAHLLMLILRHVSCCRMNMYATNTNADLNVSLYSDEVITAEFEDLIITNATDECLWKSAHLLNKMTDIYVVKANGSAISLSVFLDVFRTTNHTSKISWMDAQHCRINEVASRQFDGFSTLSELDLSHNNISKLAEFAFCNLSVSHISLQDNALETIPRHSFYNLTELVQLTLSQNKLTHIEGNAFMSVPKLFSLYMSGNRLKQIPCEELRSTGVSYLFIEDNQIEEIQEDIALLQNLQKLSARSNRIHRIDGSIKSLQNMHELLLGRNNLTTLSADLEDFFNGSLAAVDLSDNPLVCDCTLHWLISLAQDQPWKYKRFNPPPKCAYPLAINVSEINLTSLDCEDVAVFIPERPFNLVIPIVPSVVLVIFIILFSALVWLLRGRVKKKFKNIQMIYSEQYYGGSEVWSAEEITQVKTAKHKQGNSENNNFKMNTSVLNGKLRLGKLLGRGAFGEVYEAFTMGSGFTWKKVAVKKIRDNTSVSEKGIIEAELKQLVEIGQHPNIINLIGSGFIDGCLFIVMELAELGDLHAYLHSLEAKHQREIDGLDISEHQSYLLSKHPQLFVFMWSISKGMDYLARLKIIHRDLAARNILLSAGPTAKISDFGLSRDLYESGYYYMNSKGRLPYKWMSPETLTNGKYTMKSDVWSFGVLLWEVVTFGSMPYPGIPPDMLVNIHKTGYIMPHPDLCPYKLYEIMVRCWQYEPKDRPPFSELVEDIDKFIQDGVDSTYLEIHEEDGENQSLLNALGGNDLDLTN